MNGGEVPTPLLEKTALSAPNTPRGESVLLKVEEYTSYSEEIEDQEVEHAFK